MLRTPPPTLPHPSSPPVKPAPHLSPLLLFSACSRFGVRAQLRFLLFLEASDLDGVTAIALPRCLCFCRVAFNRLDSLSWRIDLQSASFGAYSSRRVSTGYACQCHFLRGVDAGLARTPHR